MRLPKKLIAPSLLAISLLAGGWYVYTQTQSAFAANGLDLTIANTSYYNGAPSAQNTWQLASLDDGQGPSGLGQYLFFNFTDIKPGDQGQDAIGLSAQGADYYACVDLTLTENDDNQTNEPELTDGDTPDDPGNLFDGELGDALQFLFWIDDGDNVFEDDEAILDTGTATTTLDADWTLADTSTNIFTGSGPLLAGDSYTIGKAWCFGDLTQTPLAQDGVGNARTPIDPDGPGVSCAGDTQTNLTQTDRLKADIEILAIQADTNPDYTCGTCSLLGEFGAVQVATANQGLRKGGDPVAVDRTNPTAALGLPEQTAASGTFYSLGIGGTLTLKFAEPVEDLGGTDLSLYEITGGVYPEETALVEVSQDGLVFESLGTASSLSGPLISFDLTATSFDWIQYIRLTDTTDTSLHNNLADGFDLDGIIAGNQNVCIETIN